jgi:mannose-6-phosphate isomerase-like protein (cupin superfamily)
MSSSFKNRRVVTGHDENGKAIFVSDGPAPVVHTSPVRPGFAINEIWITSGSAAEMNAPGDPTERPRCLEPPENGTIYRLVVFPPEKDYIHKIGNDQATRDQIRAAFAFKDTDSHGPAVETKAPPHPFMHKTKTVDYGIVLSGEMTLVLDDSVAVLRPGDTVVQRATNHAWSNRGDVPCVMAFVLFYLGKD